MQTSSGNITPIYSRPWSRPWVKTAKIEITDEWRASVAEAMSEHGINQPQLAAKISATQNAVSLILAGRQGSSKYVLPICQALGIALPARYQDSLERQWAEMGAQLRAEDPEMFAQALRLVVQMSSALKKSKR